jgi:hypothetical protein
MERNMGDVKYEDLDPGIRETVRRLRDWGLNTSDSGDGVTKLLPGSGWDPEEVINIPHVYMVEDSKTFIELSTRLLHFLLGEGVVIKTQTEALTDFPEAGWIECIYDPVDDLAVIGLFRVTDDSWPKKDEKK